MTDKEAIEHLKELKILRIEFPNALQEQALDLAIKALEERPQSYQMPKDYIGNKLDYSRQQGEKEHKERIFNPFDHRTIGEI